jgi:hypothetical protein
MAMAEENYHQTIARTRQERAQREHLNRLENIQVDYREALRERDEAAARGDIDEFEMRDTDCEELEKSWAYLNPVRQQWDPRAIEWLRKHQAFRERHGAAADQAILAAHQYAIRPRNPNATNPANAGMGLTPNTPAYFEAVQNLLEMYGKDFNGVRFDPSEKALTATEAAKISGVSANLYNRALQQVSAQGRLSNQKK